MFFTHRRKRRLIAASDRARDRGDWLAAADLYRQALKLDPELGGIWVQYGHMLKESEQFEEAEKAYARAAELRPNDPDPHLQMGHVRKLLGRTEDAITAYANALKRNPELAAARAELLHMGARDALPENGPAGLRRAREMAAITTSFDRLRARVERWSEEAPAAPDDYPAFRARFPVAPPPAVSEQPVHVVVMGHALLPAMVRATLLSLLDQSMPGWTARVVGGGHGEHSVASLARVDERIGFAETLPEGIDGLVLWLNAGTVLVPQALAWFAYAAARTEGALLYADHDALLSDWRTGAQPFAPRLFPMWDPVFFAATDELPATIMTSADLIGETYRFPADATAWSRYLFDRAADGVRVVHIPRILSSITMLPAHIGDEEPNAVMRADAPPPAPRARGSERIAVIIATRDLPEMLEPCVESLRRCAEAPELLDIIILDNRSAEPRTHALLARWSSDGTATIVPFDEPFNWARANNRGAEIAQAELLCLVNNDTLCETTGWDAYLAALLRRDDVGIVGARLLYPDRSVQHAGVLMGIGRGSPIHEGVGAAEDDGGPLNRWHCRRAVPAVTGAFMGIRRELFQALGGLDEVELPIGFNDIDLCLKARAQGRGVIFEPAISLIHHESKTRGHNDTVAKLAWDHGELESFSARWGGAMLVDPGYNPGWSRRGQPFDGFVEPSERLILRHIDDSARMRPWAIEVAAQPAGE